MKSKLMSFFQGKSRERLLMLPTIVLIFLSLWIYLANQSGNTPSNKITRSLPYLSRKNSSLVEAQKAVETLKTSYNSENLTKAQKLVNKVTDTNKQKELQQQIDEVKIAKVIEIKNKEAEAAVKSLENQQNLDNLTKAQAAVDKISVQKDKEKFQLRINAIKAEAVSDTSDTAADTGQQSSSDNQENSGSASNNASTDTSNDSPSQENTSSQQQTDSASDNTKQSEAETNAQDNAPASGTSAKNQDASSNSASE